MDESQALFAAGIAIGRLDEHVRNSPKRHALNEWLVRRESMAISAGESLMTSEVSLAALMIDCQVALISKADRTAHDISAAIRLAMKWEGEGPTEAEIFELWRASERSNVRRAAADHAWSLEKDCAEAAKEIFHLMQSPSPWTAAEAVRRLWLRGLEDRNFLGGRARRLAMIVALPLIRRGFGLHAPILGIARELTRDPDQLYIDLQSLDTFMPVFLKAISTTCAITYEASLKLQRLSIDLTAPFSEERATSKLPQSVDEILAHPIVSVGFLAERLQITTKGAGNILTRLVGSQAIRQLDPEAKKNIVFVCQKALNL